MRHALCLCLCLLVPATAVAGTALYQNSSDTVQFTSANISHLADRIRVTTVPAPGPWAEWLPRDNIGGTVTGLPAADFAFLMGYVVPQTPAFPPVLSKDSVGIGVTLVGGNTYGIAWGDSGPSSPLLDVYTFMNGVPTPAVVGVAQNLDSVGIVRTGNILDFQYTIGGVTYSLGAPAQVDLSATSPASHTFPMSFSIYYFGGSAAGIPYDVSEVRLKGSTVPDVNYTTMPVLGRGGLGLLVALSVLAGLSVIGKTRLTHHHH